VYNVPIFKSGATNVKLFLSFAVFAAKISEVGFIIKSLGYYFSKLAASNDDI